MCLCTRVYVCVLLCERQRVRDRETECLTRLLVSDFLPQPEELEIIVHTDILGVSPKQLLKGKQSRWKLDLSPHSLFWTRVTLFSIYSYFIILNKVLLLETVWKFLPKITQCKCEVICHKVISIHQTDMTLACCRKEERFPFIKNANEDIEAGVLGMQRGRVGNQLNDRIKSKINFRWECRPKL